MSKLYDTTVFGAERDQMTTRGPVIDVRLLRRAMRRVLAVSLLGVVFSLVMTYREYTSPEQTVCAPLGPAGSMLGWPPCVYGLAMYTALVAIAAYALARTRGGVGDEIVDASH